MENIKDTIKVAINEIKDDVGAGNDALKIKIDENQEASLNTIQAVEFELAKLGEAQKQNILEIYSRRFSSTVKKLHIIFCF
jgi:hypothetical protein